MRQVTLTLRAGHLVGKISSYAALTAVAPGDLLLAVDVSDTSMAATGTDKKVTVANLLGTGVPAWRIVLASGDVTGVTDVTNITAALTAVAAAQGTVYVAAGAWYTNVTITIPASVTLLVNPGAVINTVAAASFTGAQVFIVSNGSQIVGGTIVGPAGS